MTREGTGNGSWIVGGLLAIALTRFVASAEAQSAGAPPAAPDTSATSPGASSREGHVAYGSAGVMLLGVGVGAGATLGLYVNPDLAIEADGYLGTSTSAFGSASSTKAVGLGVRYFFTESFAVRGSLRVRRLEVDETNWFTSWLSTEEFDELRVQLDVGPDVAIASRWQFEHFFVAVDWLGVYFPLVAIDSEKQIIDPANDEILARESGDLRGFADVRILFLHLGGSG